MKSSRLIISFVLLILLAICYSINGIGSLIPRYLKKVEIGKPLITEEEKIIRSAITQIVSDEGSIYILYGRYGVVQEFDINGTYKCAYAVYCHPNGRISIAINNGKLFVRDKVDNIYVFSEGILLDFVSSDQAGPIINTVDFGEYSDAFEVRFGSICYRTVDHDPYCVISRPAWLMVYQENILVYAQFLMVLLLCIINIKRK